MAELIEIHPQNPQPRLIREIAAQSRPAASLPTRPTLPMPSAGRWATRRPRNGSAAQESRQAPPFHAGLRGPFGAFDLCARGQPGLPAAEGLTPGPYTFILPATRQVPNRLQHPKRKSIGIRVPGPRDRAGVARGAPEPLMSTTLQLPGQEHPMNDPWEIKERFEHELAASSTAGRAPRIDYGDRPDRGGARGDARRVGRCHPPGIKPDSAARASYNTPMQQLSMLQSWPLRRFPSCLPSLSTRLLTAGWRASSGIARRRCSGA
jgi:hypothetical protein